MKKNPNAAVAGSSTGVGIFAVWLLGYLGVEIDPALGALIAGGIATIALAVGRDGIKGVLGRLWRGKG